MITKYGKVAITEDDVLVTGFTFDCNDGATVSDCESEALAWACSRMGATQRAWTGNGAWIGNAKSVTYKEIFRWAWRQIGGRFTL